MGESNHICITCNKIIYGSEPRIIRNEVHICSNCIIDLIPDIYRLKGAGGIQHLLFRHCLESEWNRTKRISLRRYKELFQRLLHKYNFTCVNCGCKDKSKLTIDHIKPVARGGTDKEVNLQILCKSCNSKKGAKYNA